MASEMSPPQEKNCPHCTILNTYNNKICKMCNRTMINPIFIEPTTPSPAKSVVSSASSITPHTSPIKFELPPDNTSIKFDNYSYSSDSEIEFLDTNSSNKNKENINPKNQANKMKQSIQKFKLEPMKTDMSPTHERPQLMDISNINLETQKEKEESPPLFDPKYNLLFFTPESENTNTNTNTNNTHAQNTQPNNNTQHNGKYKGILLWINEDKKLVFISCDIDNNN
eukprot:39892_1